MISRAIASFLAYTCNHVPYPELSGTVQQVEKYLYHLTRWGREGEAALSKRFAARLPVGLKVRIASPCGLVSWPPE